jgi:hypothetical protein
MHSNSIIVKIALLFVALVYCYFETQNHQDFDIFILATNDFLQGGNIYKNTYEDGFHFFYGAIFSIILAPFTFMPIYLARLIWLGLNILALIKTWKLVNLYLDKTKFTPKQILWFNAFCFIFSAKLVLDNFHNGQVTIFLLLLILQGLKLIDENKKISGSVLIALGISIKLLPLLIIPYLLFIKEFKATISIAIFFFIFLLIPSVVIGFEQNNILLSDWWHLINPTNVSHIIDTDETTLNGLSTLIPTLFMDHVPDIHALEIKRNILNFNAKTVGITINVIRLVLILLTLYFLRRFPFLKAKSKLHTFWELSYILLLIPMIFPHQQHYAFLLALPACIYCIYWLMNQKHQIGKMQFNLRLVLLILIYICFNLHLLLGEFREYYDHFKLISYGSILLVILLAVCQPFHINLNAKNIVA